MDEENHSVIKEGALALQNVQTSRFYITHASPETPEARIEFGYIFRNTSPDHRQLVVPLYWLKKELQHGMSVVDGKDTELVQFDSSTCASAMVRYIRMEMNTVSRKLYTLYSDVLRVDSDDLHDGICAPIFSDHQQEKRNQALDHIDEVLETWESRLRKTLARARRFTDARWVEWVEDATEDENRVTDYHDIPSEFRDPFVADDVAIEAFNRISYLRDLVDRHRNEFRPLAILDRPLGTATDEQIPSYTLVEHTLREETDLAVPKTERLAYWTELLRRTLRGRYQVISPFPLNPDADSTHFRIELPRGVRIDYDTRPIPIDYPEEAFLSDNHDEDVDYQSSNDYEEGVWEAEEERSYTFYRTRTQVRRYYRWIKQLKFLAGDDDVSGTDLTLDLKVVAKEHDTTRILSFLLGVLSFLTFLDIYQPGSIERLPYLPAAVGMAVSLGIFTYDKPLLRKPVIGRVILSFGLIILAYILRYGGVLIDVAQSLISALGLILEVV